MKPWPHTVTIIKPFHYPDARGNQSTSFDPDIAETRTVKAWLQQDSAEENVVDGRDPRGSKWLMMAVLDSTTEVTGRERVVWAAAPGGSRTFEVAGPGEPCYRLSGYHHHEIYLRRVDG
jgi:hypothetical protein